MKRLSMVMVLVLCVPWLPNVSHAGYAEGTPFSAGNTNTTPAPDAYGQIVRIVGGSKCKATAAPPSYSEGDEVPLSCELDGDLRTNATGGGGGAGDASAANQVTQTGLLTTYATDPDTAGAWSASAIDALEVGGIETAAVSTRLQDVHVYVEYTEAVASASGSLMLMGVGR